jgi:DNA-binding SARP family transcriptional activator
VITPHVFAEKISRPAHQVGLRRARLERALLDGAAPGVALVCAPAGSGKSTLLSAVAAGAGCPVAWYRVTSDEAEADAFVAHLAAALGRCLAVPATAELDTLLAALDTTHTTCLLVLDDLHEVLGTAAERTLETFLRLRPRTVRVAMGTRRPPEINLPLLRATGELSEIGSDDLRFRVWEVEELFTAVHGTPLSPETAATLTRRTGGWAAGLQLFHLATSGKSGSARQQAVAALGPRTRLIHSYLARNVLDELDDERRRFLIDTCALGLLTGPLCDELLGATGSAAVLESLERDQLFTVSIDDGISYRYHEVLQRHLELALVAERGVDDARQWRARCGALLERAGAHRDALRAYALAEDWRAVARLVRRNSDEVTTAISVEADGMLPEQLLRDDPWLALADARRRFRRGALRQAVAGYRHAASLLDEPHFRDMCRAERTAAALWQPDPPGADGDGWPEQLRALTRRRSRAARVPAGPGAGLVLGVDALLAGDFATAREEFAAAAVAAARAELVLLRLVAQLAGVVADLAAGRTDGCDQRLEEIVLDAGFEGYPWVERLGRGLVIASLAVASGAPWRLAAAHELIAECDHDGDEWGAALLGVAVAVAADAVADPLAAAAFARAAERFRALDASRLATWAGRLGNRPRPDPAPAAAAAVEIRCFGGFEILVDQVPVDLSALRPRALVLLHLLAMQHAHVLHRERLIDLLWPGASLSVGTRRLQVAVSSIRQALAPAFADGIDLVQRTGGTYRLALPGADLDVDSFERLLTSAAGEPDPHRRIDLRREALDRYRGELLPEEGSADYVLEARDRLRLDAATAAGQLADDLLAAGRHGEAVTAARRSVDLDRYQDAGWFALAAALAASGSDAAAARTRQEYLHLRAELEAVDVTATPATT